VNQAIQDGIGQRRIADNVVPFVQWQLAGDDGRATVISIIEYLQQIPALFGLGAVTLGNGQLLK
jgi:hypothetical protein